MLYIRLQQNISYLEIEYRGKMYENNNYIEQLILNIQYELMDIDHLQPGQFIKHLFYQQVNGTQQTILNLIYEAIHQYQSQRAIIKYIKIIDKLIKYPNFIPAIQNNIIDIYSDLFMFLLIQKCHNQIQQIKILRKYWVGSIHPHVLHQIKQNILHKYNIDIDSGFKPDRIAKIKQYYQNKLKMNPQALNQHLPYVGNSIQNAKNYQNFNNYNPFFNQSQRFNTQPTFIPPMAVQRYAYPAGYNQNNHINNYNTGISQHYNPIQPNRSQNYGNNGYFNPNIAQNYPGYSDIRQNPGSYDFPNQQKYNINDRQNYYNQPKNAVSFEKNFPEKLQSSEENNMKRKRMASEQTRGAVTPTIICSTKEDSIPVNSTVEDSTQLKQLKGKKMIKGEQLVPDHIYILQKLKKLNSFCCKQCGLQFMAHENLSKHRNEHLKQKLNQNQKITRHIIKSSQLSSVEDWVSDRQQQNFQFDQFCIPVQQQFIGQILCNFCCSQLNLQFRNNQWVYSNATHVKFDNRILIMHKSCQMVLQTSKKFN